jgi:hypothetical protein
MTSSAGAGAQFLEKVRVAPRAGHQAVEPGPTRAALAAWRERPRGVQHRLAARPPGCVTPVVRLVLRAAWPAGRHRETGGAFRDCRA